MRLLPHSIKYASEILSPGEQRKPRLPAPPRYTQGRRGREGKREALSKVWCDVLFASLLLEVLSRNSC